MYVVVEELGQDEELQVSEIPVHIICIKSILSLAQMRKKENLPLPANTHTSTSFTKNASRKHSAIALASPPSL